MNEDNTPTNATPTVDTNPVPNTNQPQSYDPHHLEKSLLPKKSRKKLWIVLAVVFLIVSLVSSAGAYAYFVYLPNTPEAILKKAAENFVDSPSSYTVEGRLDNGDGNSPDFDYRLETSNSGDWKANISSYVVAVSPGAEIISKDGTLYMKSSGFLNYEQLAEDYANYTDTKYTIEYISDFAEYSELYKWNDKWLEVPSFVFEDPSVNNDTGNRLGGFNLDSLTYEVGEETEADGRKLQQYTLKLDQENVKAMVDALAGGTVASAFDTYATDNNFPETISIEVTVDTETKQFFSLSYDGRPFDDATFSFNAKQQDVTISAPEGATPLANALSYGVAWSELIRADMQAGSSERDKERIADLKGMKLAFEIYKVKNGEYPDRYSISVEQERFLNQKLPFVDHQLFIDSSGRRVGLNGSQYAYVPEQADSPEPCGDLNYGPCDKFFLVTTLDDGTEYQLNSGL